MSKSIFSQNLTRARKLKGWSQQGAAQAIGINRRTLGKYEEDNTEPDHRILEKICSAYDIINLQSFISDPDYFEKEHTTHRLISHYQKLEQPIKQAVDILLGITGS